MRSITESTSMMKMSTAQIWVSFYNGEASHIGEFLDKGCLRRPHAGRYETAAFQNILA
jgi:hypothetical protein